MKKIMIALLFIMVFVLSISVAFAGQDDCHGSTCDTPGHECEHGQHEDNPHCQPTPEENTNDNISPTDDPTQDSTEEVSDDPTSEPTQEVSDDPTSESTEEVVTEETEEPVPTKIVPIATQGSVCNEYFSLWDIPNLDIGYVGTNLNNAFLLVGYREGDHLAQPYLAVIPGGNMFYVPEYNKSGVHLWDENIWFAMSRGCGRLHGAQELGLLVK